MRRRGQTDSSVQNDKFSLFVDKNLGKVESEENLKILKMISRLVR